MMRQEEPGAQRRECGRPVGVSPTPTPSTVGRKALPEWRMAPIVSPDSRLPRRSRRFASIHQKHHARPRVHVLARAEGRGAGAGGAVVGAVRRYEGTKVRRYEGTKVRFQAPGGRSSDGRFFIECSSRGDSGRLCIVTFKAGGEGAEDWRNLCYVNHLSQDQTFSLAIRHADGFPNVTDGPRAVRPVFGGGTRRAARVYRWMQCDGASAQRSTEAR
jgi:hypothetical protein